MLDSINVMFWERIHSKENLGVNKVDDYNARCDICGDSQKSKNKKRLHLYKKDSYQSDSIKCFNCGYTGTMKSYIKNYHPNFLQEYINMTSTKNLRDLNLTNFFEKKTESKELETFNIPLPKATANKQAENYVKSRGGNPNDFYYSEGNFRICDKDFELKNFIIYPNIVNGEVISFYSRSLDTKQFYIYAPNAGTKSIGYYLANKEKYVFLFEGLFDMLCVPLNNKIALLGANCSWVTEFPKVCFCVDNDKTGLETMLRYTNNLNYKFCIWCDDPYYSKFKDINEVYQSGVNILQFIKDHTVDNITAECRIKMSINKY